MKKTFYLLLFILCMYVAAKWPNVVIFLVEWVFVRMKALFLYVVSKFKPAT